MSDHADLVPVGRSERAPVPPVRRAAGSTGPRSDVRAWSRLLLVVVALLLAPLPLRLIARVVPPSQITPSYLPAIEANRERAVPFDAEAVRNLRTLDPTWVFLGDSMLGTRIDPVQLSAESGYRGVAVLAHAGSGSAFWYLALKNWVIPSGVHPRYVFVFFRDDNLTDPLFRGPIERAARLLPRLERPRRFSPTDARDAVTLMVWGFFKKLVIADNVGVIANKVFALENPHFWLLWAGVFAFAIQIYADFSAYSDIARGSARWLGIDLMINFDHPYLARTPRDYWRRWHISLSTWFRDYVYIPLGGSRGSEWVHTRNVIVTFLLSGFWHGASWNYILWGFYHGVLLATTRPFEWLERPRHGWARMITAIQVVVMFALTPVGWLLFRETNLHYLVKWLTLSPSATSPIERGAALYLFGLTLLYSLPLWLHAALAAARPALRDWLLAFGEKGEWVRAWTQAAVVAGMALLILVLRSHTSLDFIYFQF